MNLYEFLKEVITIIEDYEDKELLEMILEKENDIEISSEEFLSFIDKHLYAGNH